MPSSPVRSATDPEGNFGVFGFRLGQNCAMPIDEKQRALFASWDRISARLQNTSFQDLSLSEQMFVAIWILEAEINNGGLSQWMFNSSGDHGSLTVAALREVGAVQAANICERFFSMLPGGAPLVDRNARQAQLEAAIVAAGGEDAFDRTCRVFEEEFYALEERLRDQLLAFSQRLG